MVRLLVLYLFLINIVLIKSSYCQPVIDSIYLSINNGSDNWNGTEQFPYHSFQKVYDILFDNYMNSMDKGIAVAVYAEPGTYNIVLSTSLVLTGMNLTIAAWNETPPTFNFTLNLYNGSYSFNNIQYTEYNLNLQTSFVSFSNATIQGVSLTVWRCQIFIVDSVTTADFHFLDSNLTIQDSELTDSNFYNERSFQVTLSGVNILNLFIVYGDQSRPLISKFLIDRCKIYLFGIQSTNDKSFNGMSLKIIDSQIQSFETSMNRFILENSEITIINTGFIDLYGNFFQVENSSFALDQVSFVGVKSYQVFTLLSSTLYLNNTYFDRPKAQYLISTYNSTVVVKNLNYTEFESTIINIYPPSNVTIDQCTFTNLFSNPTVITMNNYYETNLDPSPETSEILIQDSSFTEINSLYFSSSNIVVRNSNFTSSIPIYLFISSHSNISIESCQFQFDTPYAVSVFFISYSRLTINGSSCNPCSSLAFTWKADIFLDALHIPISYSSSMLFLSLSSSSMVLSNSDFRNTNFQSLFKIENSNSMIINSTFTSCLNTEYFASVLQSSMVIENSTFTANSNQNFFMVSDSSSLVLNQVRFSQDFIASIFFQVESNSTFNSTACLFDNIYSVSVFFFFHDTQVTMEDVLVNNVTTNLLIASGESTVSLREVRVDSSKIDMGFIHNRDLVHFQNLTIANSYLFQVFQILNSILTADGLQMSALNFMNIDSMISNSTILMSNSMITDSAFQCNVFSLLASSTGTFENLLIRNNSIAEGNVVYLSNGDAEFFGVEAYDNTMDSVIFNTLGDISLEGCVFQNNSAVTGVISCSNSGNPCSVLRLVDSSFIGNWNAYGTCLYTASYFIFGEFGNNRFVNNSASKAGAVLFSYQRTEIDLSGCVVSGNTAMYGSTLASPPSSFYISGPATVLNTEDFSVDVQLKDDYNNTVLDETGNNFVLTITESDGTPNYNQTSILISGQYLGRLSVEGDIGEQFIVQAEWEYIKQSFNISISPCLVFQYSNDKVCQYCPPGQAYSTSQSECLQCHDSKLFCQQDTVYSLSGFCFLDNDISNLYQCQPNLCLSSNKCQSPNNYGLLCSQCSNSPAKHGIYCCESFTPSLFVLYLLFLIVIGLLVSLFRLSYCQGIFGHIIIQLQYYSIIFHTIPNLQLIPLFRFSIDFVSNQCIFKELDFVGKVLVSLSSLMLVMAIGYHDLPTRAYQFISRRRGIQKPHSIIKLNMIHRSRFTENQYRVKVIYSNLLLFAPTILFNLLSLILCKRILSTNYLSMDLSTLCFNQGHSSQFVFGIISIVILFALLVLLPLYIIYSLKSGKNTFYLILRSSGYHKKALYWDIVHLYKSLYLGLISILLQYDITMYIVYLTAYQVLTVFLHSIPFQPKISQYRRRIESISDLLLLMLVLYYSTSFFWQLSPRSQGNLITSLLAVIIIITLLCNRILRVRLGPKAS